MKAVKLLILSGIGVVVVGVAVYFLVHKPAGSSGDILSMCKSGASETEMLNAIDKSTGTGKIPPPEDLIALKQAGASDRVLIALVQKNSARQASAAK